MSFLWCCRCILEESHHRPATCLNNERYYIYSVCIERRVIPAILLVLFLVNVLRYVFLGDLIGHWTEVFIVMQVNISD